MNTVKKYLDELTKQKSILTNNLNLVGVEANATETFNTLISKIPNVRLNVVEILNAIISREGKELVIPDGVSKIGYCAFLEYRNLTSIVLPNSIISIDGDAFRGCSNLKTVTIPNGVKQIGGWCFHSCIALEEIEIPKGITKISEKTFYKCRGLKSVVFKGVPTSIDTSAFMECTQNDLVIYCPWNKGEVANAPWGATNATIIYNYKESLK